MDVNLTGAPRSQYEKMVQDQYFQRGDFAPPATDTTPFARKYPSNVSSSWDFSSSSPSSSEGVSYSSYTPPRELTPEEIAARERAAEEFRKAFVFAAKSLSLLITSPIWGPWKIAKAGFDKVSPSKSNHVKAALITTGIYGIAGTIVGLNIAQDTHIKQTYPSVGVAYGMSGSEKAAPDYFYFASTDKNDTRNVSFAKCKDFQANCKMAAQLSIGEPECIRMTTLNHNYGYYPELKISGNLVQGKSISTKASEGLTCSKNFVTDGNFLRCSPTEVFFCNNADTMNILMQELGLLEKSKPNQAAPTPMIYTAGIVVDAKNSGLVTGVLEGSSAYRSGVGKGDFISEIDYVPIKNWTKGQVEAELASVNNPTTIVTIKFFQGRDMHLILDKEKIPANSKVIERYIPPKKTAASKEKDKTAVVSENKTETKPVAAAKADTPKAAPISKANDNTQSQQLTPTWNYFVVQGSGVNLRNGPSTTAPSTGVVDGGSCVIQKEMHAAQAGFMKVTVVKANAKAYVGFVSDDYLKPANAAQAAACTAVLR